MPDETAYAEFFPVIKKNRPLSVASQQNRTSIDFRGEDTKIKHSDDAMLIMDSRSPGKPNIQKKLKQLKEKQQKKVEDFNQVQDQLKLLKAKTNNLLSSEGGRVARFRQFGEAQMRKNEETDKKIDQSLTKEKNEKAKQLRRLNEDLAHMQSPAKKEIIQKLLQRPMSEKRIGSLKPIKVSTPVQE